MDKTEPADSVPPTPVAPKLHTTALPDVADEPTVGSAAPITGDTGAGSVIWLESRIGSALSPGLDLSTLTTAQVYDLNQSLLEEATGVSRPLIDEIAPISALRAEYENGNPSFLKQIDWLAEKGYHYIRRTKGDGDCFYRSVAFAYVERVMSSLDPFKAAEGSIKTLQSTMPMLENVGFQKLVFEDFYDVLETMIKNVVTPDPVTKKTLNGVGLVEAFQSPEVSNSIVVYLRLLTSAQIRMDPDTYAPFLFHPELGEQMEVRDFCESFVEAVSKEADHVQMTALSRALEINVNVAYLDGRNPNGQVEFVEFRNPPDSLDTPITLLYRPGHYDILLKIE